MTLDHGLTIICATNWINNRAMKLRQTAIFIVSTKNSLSRENFLFSLLQPCVVDSFDIYSTRLISNKIIRRFGEREKKFFYWYAKQTSVNFSKNKIWEYEKLGSYCITTNIISFLYIICNSSKLFIDFTKKTEKIQTKNLKSTDFESK